MNRSSVSWKIADGGEPSLLTKRVTFSEDERRELAPTKTLTPGAEAIHSFNEHCHGSFARKDERR